ncbi:MAG: hypothetical protein HYR74_00850 [Candidatus Eisenbacteria bacterium]|nr:hypothetical protein [Candidatus Eisenbacteria bacterium]
MQRRLTSPLTLLLLATAVIGAPGCAKKLTTPDAGLIAGSFPPGVRDSLDRTPSNLTVWPDTPLPVYDANSGLLLYTAYRSQAGAYVGEITDYTGATGYQMFRREGNQAFSMFQDFALTPTRRWADHDYYGTANGTLVLPPAQLYEFADPVPPAVADPAYVGRALIAGLTGAAYPLTNLGVLTPGVPIDSMAYTGSSSPPDSLVGLTWQAVPGAVGYWVHVYQKRSDIRDGSEVVVTALPAAIATGKVRDFFIGYFPASVTSYKVGSPVPTGARVLVYRILAGQSAVFIRVSAVDATGRMIATTLGPDSDTDATHQNIGGQDVSIRYSINARRVTPQRPLPPPIAAP